jgi:hypothetical protein
MSAFDLYVAAAVQAMGDPDSYQHARDGESPHAGYMRRVAYLAIDLCELACSTDGHDLEPIVDLANDAAWWRCRRCGRVPTDGDFVAEVEGLEPLESHMLRARGPA